MSACLLQLVDIGFQTDQFTALEHICWEIDSDHYYQIIGANASGKTTLLNLMAGVCQPTSGTILWKGKPTVFRSPQEAYAHNIIFLQDVPKLFLQASVAENVITAANTCRANARMLRRPGNDVECCRRVFQELGIEIDPHETAVNLNLFQQRILELARIYYQGTSLVLMDSLSNWCSDEELRQVRTLLGAIHRKHGCAMIFCASSVQHIIPECSSILYLKGGHAVACVQRDRQDILQIPEEFRSARLAYPKLDLVGDKAVLELRDFELPYLTDSPYSHPSQFVLHEGEIIGIYGMDTPHCQAVCEIFTGQRWDYRGQIRVNGLPAHIQSPRHALRLGIACQPLLKNEALFPDLDLCMNVIPPVLVRQGHLGPPIPKYYRAAARYHANQLHIKPPDPSLRCRFFSGANQQKMLISRYDHQSAKAYILFNPTTGMDMQSKLDVYNLFTHLQRRGCGIILFSNDLDELAYMCDRIHVVRSSYTQVIQGTSRQRVKQLYNSILQLRK